MTSTSLNQNELTQAITAALSRGSARVGRRLRSEPELARLLGTQRWRLREALNHLVDQKVIVRRKGSGSYLRKVPRAAQAQTATGRLVADLGEKLFADDPRSADHAVPLKPTRAQTQLHLALWGVHGQSTAHHRLVQAIRDRARTLGHRLSIHPTMRTLEQPFTISELARQISDQNADGHIVATGAADRFLQAAATPAPPILFINSANSLLQHEPTVLLDRDDAIIRGVYHLAEQGYRRIALLGLEPFRPGSDYRPIELAYLQGLRELGLDYHRAILCASDPQASTTAASQLLTGPDAPDALYVSDDYVMLGVARALAQTRRTPGRDTGVIFTAHRGGPVPPGPNWSRIEMDGQWYGQLIIDTFLRFIQSADSRAGNVKVAGNWRPGTTHLRQTVTPP